MTQIRQPAPRAESLDFDDDTFTVTMNDGSTITAPLNETTFPRLWHATAAERGCYRIDGHDVRDQDIYWPNLNELTTIQQLLNGIDNSGESRTSVARWLEELNEFRSLSPQPDTTFTEWQLQHWRRPDRPKAPSLAPHRT